MLLLFALIGPFTLLIALWVGAALFGVIFRRIWVGIVGGIFCALCMYFWWTMDLFRMNAEVTHLCEKDAPVIYSKIDGVDSIYLSSWFSGQDEFLIAVTNLYGAVVTPMGLWGSEKNRIIRWRRSQPGDDAGPEEIRPEDKPEYQLSKESPAVEITYRDFKVFKETIKVISAKSGRVLGTASLYSGVSFKSSEFDLERLFLSPKVASCQLKDRIPFITQVLKPKQGAQ